jgi:mRNA interferase MazF
MKNYEKWHLVKSKIESLDKKELFREREIWWCSIWENIGFEQDGKNEQFERPVLVLKKFSHDVFLGIPMTSTQKEHPLYFPYQLNDTSGSFILSQARILSVKRLQRKITSLGRGIFSDIKSQYIKIIS